MSRRDLLRGGLARRRPPDEDVSAFAAMFLRGLGIGALIGAAVAGAALLQRRSDRPEKRERAARE